MSIALRRARPEEADALTALAIRSKAHWGYDADFMQRCIPELRITPEDLAHAAAAYVAEERDGPSGVYILIVRETTPTLSNLWIDPPAIGRGVGRRLWEHMLAEARAAGFDTVRLEADPNAAGFYERMGAQHVGDAPSRVAPGRLLPVFEVTIAR